jgi:hypothetical protein
MPNPDAHRWDVYRRGHLLSSVLPGSFRTRRQARTDANRTISFTPSSGGRAPLGIVGSPDRTREVQPPRRAPAPVSSSVNGGLVACYDPPSGLLVLASRIQKGAARPRRGLRVR